MTDVKTKKSHFRMDGPDGGWAWCVALAVCLVTFIMAGLARMSGILYVAFIHAFDVNRMEAAVPFSIRSSTKNLLGPAVGILGQQYGVRAVVLAGGLVATVSAAACYFASNILLVTVLWGALNGIGCALTITLLQVVIGQHFKKYHSTAAGLAFSGGCVGSFLFPVLIEFLLNNFGLEGTFLILAGVIMHTIPAALVLRKPSWIKNQGAKQDVKTIDNLKNVVLTTDATRDPRAAKSGISTEATESRKVIGIDFKTPKEFQYATGSSAAKIFDVDRFYWLQNDKTAVAEVIYRFINRYDSKNELIFVIRSILERDGNHNIRTVENEMIIDVFREIISLSSKPSSRQPCSTAGGRENLGFVENEIGMYNKSADGAKTYFAQQMEKMIDDFLLSGNFEGLIAEFPEGPAKNENMIKSIVLEVREVCRHIQETSQAVLDQRKEVVLDVDKIIANMSGNAVNSEQRPEEKAEDKSPRKAGFRQHIKTALKLNSNPFFLLICFCRTVHYMTVLPFVTVIVDFSKDKGIPEEYGKYVIAALSAGDLAGRLGLGWVTDKNYLSMPKFMLLSMVAQGAATAALPLVNSMYYLMVLIAFFGMLQGSVFIRHPVLVKRYISSDQQSIAIGCINFFWGIIGFAQPLYIGYFRDTLGSYDLMFYITASIETCVGLLWFLEPHLVKYAPVKNDAKKRGLPAQTPETGRK